MWLTLSVDHEDSRWRVKGDQRTVNRPLLEKQVSKGFCPELFHPYRKRKVMIVTLQEFYFLPDYYVPEQIEKNFYKSR